jgi:Flp pilus assembly pilin Flp
VAGNNRQHEIYAAIVVIVAFVLLQFIQMPLGRWMGVDVSLQKVVGFLVLPLAYCFMAKAAIPRQLILWTGVQLLTGLIAYAALGDYCNINAFKTIALAAMGLICSVILYTALQRRACVLLFVRVWVWTAFTFAVISILQALGVLPIWTGDWATLDWHFRIGTFARGVGLKLDPNFAALVMGLGLWGAYSCLSGYCKHVVLFVIMMGMLATYSRMGLYCLALTLVWAVAVDYRLGVYSRKSLLRLVGIIAVVLIAACLLNPEYFVTRMIKAPFEVIQHALHGDLGRSDDDVRLMLAAASFDVLREYPLTGLGAFRSIAFMEQYAGLSNVVHNTYLEFMVTGGFWGIVAAILYLAIPLRDLLVVGKSSPGVALHISIALVFFYLCSCFLSLNYNYGLWLPIVFMAACRKAYSDTAGGLRNVGERHGSDDTDQLGQIISC